jgi:hypothetical protein
MVSAPWSVFSGGQGEPCGTIALTETLACGPSWVHADSTPGAGAGGVAQPASTSSAAATASGRMAEAGTISDIGWPRSEMQVAHNAEHAVTSVMGDVLDLIIPGTMHVKAMT